MSDILEDSRVHAIVKDYKRMYEGFHRLVEENKSLRNDVEELRAKNYHLHSELEKKEKAEAKKKVDKSIKGRLNESLCQINSLNDKAKKIIEQSERLMKTIKQLDEEIRK